MVDSILRYVSRAAGLRACAEPEGTLQVADSWLLRDGRVRALDRHFARFTASCREYQPSCELDGFLAAVRGVLADAGDAALFPRIELRSERDADPGDRLFLRLRPAPARQPRARLWTLDGPDPRRVPRVKGPDLDLLATVRERARAAGADEALLLGPAGEVLEGAFSSLIWWRGGVLHVPPRDAPVLPGVTLDLVVELARRENVPVVNAAAELGDLDGAEIWLTSALSGIRAVHGEIAAGVTAAEPRLTEAWHERLVDAASPVR